MPRIQKHVYLAFEVRGKNLKPENANLALREFYRLLNKIKFERGGLKIVLSDKDPANLEQIDSTWIKGSIHLNMEVIGYRKGEEFVRDIDHDTEVLILRELLKLKVDEGKYTKHITIQVLEATFTQSQKRYPNVWPREEIPVVGF